MDYSSAQKKKKGKSASTLAINKIMFISFQNMWKNTTAPKREGCVHSHHQLRMDLFICFHFQNMMKNTTSIIQDKSVRLR